MKITSETSLRDFDFWSGAKDTAKHLTNDELDTVESIIEELYPDGIDETTLNDIMWFEADQIADWLGYEDFDAIMSRDEDEDEDEDEEESEAE